MSSLTSVASGAKGIRGLAQDLIAPELRALAERVHSLEKLTEERFKHVDERFEQIDRRFEQLEKRMDRIEAKLDAMPTTLMQMVNQLAASMDISHRVTRLEQTKLPEDAQA